jgi:hypothetical protein
MVGAIYVFEAQEYGSRLPTKKIIPDLGSPIVMQDTVVDNGVAVLATLGWSEAGSAFIYNLW